MRLLILLVFAGVAYGEPPQIMLPPPERPVVEYSGPIRESIPYPKPAPAPYTAPVYYSAPVYYPATYYAPPVRRLSFEFRGPFGGGFGACVGAG